MPNFDQDDFKKVMIEKGMEKKPFNPFDFHNATELFSPSPKPEPFVKKDEKINELIERVDAMERLIKVTFNGHVLIDGRFMKIIP